jgi:hypothetical protein
MVDAALVPKGDGELARVCLRLADQERPVDARAEQLFGTGPGDFAMVPTVCKYFYILIYIFTALLIINFWN